MPSPNGNHQKLHALAGRWIGRENIHPTPWDPAGGEATAKSAAIVALGGFCVIMDDARTRAGKAS